MSKGDLLACARCGRAHNPDFEYDHPFQRVSGSPAPVGGWKGWVLAGVVIAAMVAAWRVFGS